MRDVVRERLYIFLCRVLCLLSLLNPEKNSPDGNIIKLGTASMPVFFFSLQCLCCVLGFFGADFNLQTFVKYPTTVCLVLELLPNYFVFCYCNICKRITVRNNLAHFRDVNTGGH